jgi:hypothetical protein
MVLPLVAVQFWVDIGEDSLRPQVSVLSEWRGLCMSCSRPGSISSVLAQLLQWSTSLLHGKQKHVAAEQRMALLAATTCGAMWLMLHAEPCANTTPPAHLALKLARACRLC